MRLAFIKKSFSLHGGAELYLKTLLGELRKEGHDIHIFSNRWTDEPDFTFHKIDIMPLTSFLSVLSFSRNAAKALRNESFDCIVSFERTEYQDIYRAGDGCHMAWLAIRSDVEPFYKRISFGINPLHRYTLSLEKQIFAETPLIVVNSEMVKEQLRRYYATPAEKIRVAYNGVDLERFNPSNRNKWRSETRRSVGIGENEKVILFVGSGFRRKGLETLIRSLPEVKRSLKSEKISAIVIGKGDASDYRRTAESLGLGDEVVFAGPRKKIERFYAAADIFVLPTIYDPFSNACLEAMASGLPVVTTKNNGASEIIDEGKEGFITSSVNDPSELALKIAAALSNTAEIGMRARARAEHFSIDSAACFFIGIIRRAASDFSVIIPVK